MGIKVLNMPEMEQLLYKMTIEEVKGIVENYYNFNLSVRSRKREIVFARFIFYKLAYDFCKIRTLSKVGKSVKKDHATVIYGLKEFDNIMPYDKDFEKDYLNLKRICNEYSYNVQDIINKSKKIYGTIRVMHPMRIYGKKESIRKILKQRRSPSKGSYELHSSKIS